VSDVSEQIVRPSPLQWLRYALLGSVPAKNRAWVLHDVTCSTWALRHAARYFALVTPLIIAVMIFLPAALSLRVEACFTAAASVLIGYMCFATESLERRAQKAGYPHGIAAQLREHRANETQRAVVARNWERRENRLYRGR
jgi:hypothetical protein